MIVGQFMDEDDEVVIPLTLRGEQGLNVDVQAVGSGLVSVVVLN